MSVIFGAFARSAYARFWPGIWAIVVSVSMSTGAVVGLMVSRYSSPSSTAASTKLMSRHVQVSA